MSDYLKPLREPVNVADALERDRLVRRLRNLRARVVLDKSDIEHWNRTHPDEKQFDTAVEDAIIACCDGQAPMPTTFIVDGKSCAWVDGKIREIPTQEGAA